MLMEITWCEEARRAVGDSQSSLYASLVRNNQTNATQTNSKMCIKIFLFTYSLLTVLVDSSFFDQSQSGDLNVQVDLKGLHVFALMKGGKEEYVDYDYAYDYSEMTIKPQNRTTMRPLNVISTTAEPELEADKNNVTIATTVYSETTTPSTKTSEIAEVTIQQTVNHDNSTIKNTITYSNVTDPPAIKLNTTTVVTTTTPISNSTTPITCRKGFVLNSKGDCKLKLEGTGNALLKLVKLSQKLKLRRENKSDHADLN